MKGQNLIINQIDKKIYLLNNAKDLNIPLGGWVYSIRTALKMTLKQLGKRIGISAPAVIQIEQREKSGTVSLNVMRQAGEALNMKFIYGFIPEKGTLEEMIEERATVLAKKIVLRTSNTMQLEDQENTEERISKAIQEKKEEIIQKMPRYLWD